MQENIIHSDDARQKIQVGINALADAVKVTLGAKGKNVVLAADFLPLPRITKDGVSVARHVKLEDPIEDIGAQLVKEVASKTADEAGDGTTTATILTQAIFNLGMKNLASGANPKALKNGIDLAVQDVLKHLSEQAKEIQGNDVENIATISGNNDPTIGKMIAEAISKVGKEGIITLEEGRSSETEIEVVEGLQINRGYLAPHFINRPAKAEVELLNPYILLYDKRITNIRSLLRALELSINNNRPILIIAEDVEGEALGTLIINKKQGKISACAVAAPSFGDKRLNILEDIAILTNGKVISETFGTQLEEIDSVSYFGECEKAIIKKDSTIIVNGYGDPADIEARIDQIKAQIAEDKDKRFFDHFESRLASLTGGVAVIRVGAPTEPEMKERKDRIEDAIFATKAALKEGVVTGGGIALFRAYQALSTEDPNIDQATGRKIIKQAILEPLKTIIKNAGDNEYEVIAEITKAKKKSIGYNAATGKVEDLDKLGIIDPKMVTRLALENAASIAGLLLTTDAIVTDFTDKKFQQNQ